MPWRESDTATSEPSGEGTNQSMVVPPLLLRSVLLLQPLLQLVALPQLLLRSVALQKLQE